MNKTDICHIQTEVGYEIDMPFPYSVPFHWLCAAEHNLGNHMMKKAEPQEGEKLLINEEHPFELHMTGKKML